MDLTKDQIIEILTKTNEQQAVLIESLQKMNEDFMAEIQKLNDKLEEFTDLLFKQKSEKTKNTEEKMPRVKPNKEPLTEEEKKEARAKTKKKRKEQREKQNKLPVEDIKIPVTKEQCQCEHCNPMQFKIIGSKVIERIEFIPAILKKQRFHLQTKKCLCGNIVSSEVPANVVEGGRYGAGFHAHVVVSKVDDSLPLERQAKILGRAGVEINQSTLCDIFHRSADLLSPIYRHLVAEIKTSNLVNADETRLKLQRPNKCKEAYMWVFLDGDQIIYVFSESRSGETPVEILGNSNGLLQVDAYSGYNQVTTPETRMRIGCWSHVRRYFFKAKTDPDAEKIFRWINELYRVEYLAAEREELGTEAHLKLRNIRSAEILSKIKEKVDIDIKKEPPGSKYGKALKYVSNNWDSLKVFLTDVKIKLDNNLSERALRIIAIGRKNYLFVGSKQAGKNLAVLQTLVQTCKLHQVNPQEYLADVLIRVQSHPQSKIAQLHPKNWKSLVSED